MSQQVFGRQFPEGKSNLTVLEEPWSIEGEFQWLVEREQRGIEYASDVVHELSGSWCHGVDVVSESDAMPGGDFVDFVFAITVERSPLKNWRLVRSF